MLARGTDHPSARLTEDDVRTIRARLAAGESRAGIARAYGMHRTTINDLARGITWAWLDNDERTAP